MLSSSEIKDLRESVALLSNTSEPDVYDTVERWYKFDDACEKFLRGTDVHSEVMLRRTFGRDSSEWEIKHEDQKIGRRWKEDDVNLSSDLYGRVRGDVQAALREIGFRFVKDRITRVFEYSVGMYSASVLIFVPWKYHNFLREEWGLSSKPIYTIRSSPSSSKRSLRTAWNFLSLLGQDKSLPTKTTMKRQKRAEVWNVDIIHPYVKQKNGSDQILGQGSNEDPKLAHEEAASKARLALLGSEVLKKMEENSRGVEEKYLVKIETVVSEPEIKNACARLHKLRRCVGLYE